MFTAFLLADSGYDVWFMNQRGNFYSRHHLTLSPDRNRAAFWNFSFHEHGIYDAPASIDYILNITGQNGVSIIGQSMGTTTAFIMLSKRPEYNEKIRAFICMAPNAIFTHSVPGLYYNIGLHLLPLLEVSEEKNV